MNEAVVALLIFALLVGAALVTHYLYPKLPQKGQDDDTNALVRIVANLFTLMTSLVLGLMINQSRSAFEEINQSVHAFASQLIVLNLTLDQIGPESAGMKQPLISYAEGVRARWSGETAGPGKPDADHLLEAFDTSLDQRQRAAADRGEVYGEARQQLEQLAKLRWDVSEESDDIVPGGPLVLMLVAWLTVIFASFGYRSPRNLLVFGIFTVSAGLMAGTLYLVMDMERPLSGPIRVSVAPIERALAEMRD